MVTQTAESSPIHLNWHAIASFSTPFLLSIWKTLIKTGIYGKERIEEMQLCQMRRWRCRSHTGWEEMLIHFGRWFFVSPTHQPHIPSPTFQLISGHYKRGLTSAELRIHENFPSSVSFESEFVGVILEPFIFFRIASLPFAKHFLYIVEYSS